MADRPYRLFHLGVSPGGGTPLGATNYAAACTAYILGSLAERDGARAAVWLYAGDDRCANYPARLGAWSRATAEDGGRAGAYVALVDDIYSTADAVVDLSHHGDVAVLLSSAYLRRRRASGDDELGLAAAEAGAFWERAQLARAGVALAIAANYPTAMRDILGFPAWGEWLRGASAVLILTGDDLTRSVRAGYRVGRYACDLGGEVRAVFVATPPPRVTL